MNLKSFYEHSKRIAEFSLLSRRSRNVLSSFSIFICSFSFGVLFILLVFIIREGDLLLFPLPYDKSPLLMEYSLLVDSFLLILLLFSEILA